MNIQPRRILRVGGTHPIGAMILGSASLGLMLITMARVAYAASLGPATGYNLFVQENLFQDTVHAQGRVAVGGNITATQNYGIGDRIGTGDVLVVGGNINLGSNGQVNGRAVYGGTSAVANATQGIVAGNPIDFIAAFDQLRALSLGFVPNGTVSAPDTSGTRQLVGSDASLNIFELNGVGLTNTQRYQFDTPDTALNVINIRGDNFTLANGNFDFLVPDALVPRVVYNFPDATVINAQMIGLRGNVLAPWAQFNADNGQILGTGIFRSVQEIPNVDGVFEYNQLTPEAIVSNNLPAIPTPALLPGITGMLWQSWRKRHCTKGKRQPQA